MARGGKNGVEGAVMIGGMASIWFLGLAGSVVVEGLMGTFEFG